MRVETHARGMLVVPDLPRAPLPMPDGTTTSGEAVVSRVRPVNDFLALRDDVPYLEWLEKTWGHHATRRAARRWIKQGVPERLVQAAREGKGRRVPYATLAPELQRVKHDRTGLEVPSLPVLAAWSLQMAVMDGYRLATCGECGSPWYVRSAKLDYCRRPAPGQTMTCEQMHKHERFAQQREEWNKEYRRIYARMLRGSIERTEWKAWRADILGSANAPESYFPFDLWRSVVREPQLHREALADLDRKLREFEQREAVRQLREALRQRFAEREQPREEEKDGGNS